METLSVEGKEPEGSGKGGGIVAIQARVKASMAQ